MFGQFRFSNFVAQQDYDRFQNTLDPLAWKPVVLQDVEFGLGQGGLCFGEACFLKIKVRCQGLVNLHC